MDRVPAADGTLAGISVDERGVDSQDQGTALWPWQCRWGQRVTLRSRHRLDRQGSGQLQAEARDGDVQ